MASFDDVFDTIKKGVADLAGNTFHEVKDSVVASTNQLLEDNKSDIKQWTQQLTAGDLTQEDLEWLLKARIDAAELTLLYEAGLTAVQIDKFKNDLFNLVIDSVKKIL
jgi:hypothetical protein